MHRVDWGDQHGDEGGQHRKCCPICRCCLICFFADTDTISSAIHEWETQDGNEAAAAFKMFEYLPLMFNAVMTMSHWDSAKIVQAWTMFLVAMCMMARASDVTRFCPTYEDIQLAPPAMWDEDGTPQFIELGLRDWKWRSYENKRKKTRYGMRIWKNEDPRFCPVRWLLLWLKISGIKSGPIFQRFGSNSQGGLCTGEPLAEGMWCGMTSRIWAAVGLHALGCTNHSIRVTACQWCGRCGGTVLDAKNTGRWKTTQEMSRYFQEGAREGTRLREGGGKDPLLKMWIWRPCTIGGEDGRSQM